MEGAREEFFSLYQWYNLYYCLDIHFFRICETIDGNRQSDEKDSIRCHYEDMMSQFARYFLVFSPHWV